MKLGNPRNNGRAHDDVLIRRSLVDTIRKSKMDRKQIAESMTACLRRTVTARMITAFTAESKELHRWPAEFDIAFCEATGDYSLLRERVKRAGFRMIGPEEEELIEIGKAYVAKMKAERKLAEVQL